MVTQLLYIIIFSKAGFSFKKLISPKRLCILFLFGLIYFALMYILFDQLKDFLIPVLIYGAVVCMMGFCATIRNVNQASYLLVLIGACFFIISDSLIAVNKFLFASNLYLAQPIIMIFYVLAQFFIVIGLIKAYK